MLAIAHEDTRTPTSTFPSTLLLRCAAGVVLSQEGLGLDYAHPSAASVYRCTARCIDRCLCTCGATKSNQIRRIKQTDILLSSSTTYLSCIDYRLPCPPAQPRRVHTVVVVRASCYRYNHEVPRTTSSPASLLHHQVCTPSFLPTHHRP